MQENRRTLRKYGMEAVLSVIVVIMLMIGMAEGGIREVFAQENGSANVCQGHEWRNNKCVKCGVMEYKAKKNTPVWNGTDSFSGKKKTLKKGTKVFVSSTFKNRFDNEWGELSEGGYVYMSNLTLVTHKDSPEKVKIEDGLYMLLPQNAQEQCLDVTGAGTDSGINVQINERKEAASQRFMISQVGDDYYRITLSYSGKCLDVAEGRAVSGNNVWQYEKNDTASQKWCFEDAGDGYYYIHTALNTELCLDVAGGEAASGTNVQIYAQNYSSAQKWKLVCAYEPGSGIRRHHLSGTAGEECTRCHKNRDAVMQDRIDDIAAALDGKYFTCTGKPCKEKFYKSHPSSSSCNGNCSLTNVSGLGNKKLSSPSIPELFGEFKSLGYFPRCRISTGSSNYLGSSCFGFAVFAHYLCITNHNGCDTKGKAVAGGEFTYNFMKKNARPGDYLRFDGSHSAVLYSVNKDSITIIDCNGVINDAKGNCQVLKRNIKYSTFKNVLIDRADQKEK